MILHFQEFSLKKWDGIIACWPSEILISGNCNLFSGEWVYNSPLKPLYDSLSCPYINSEFDCLKFGRPGKDFLNYSRNPSSCSLPRSVCFLSVHHVYIHKLHLIYILHVFVCRFDGVDFLKRWRGKKIMFVGDSLSLNQWTSLVCMLHAAQPNTSFLTKNPSKITFEVSFSFRNRQFLLKMRSNLKY